MSRETKGPFNSIENRFLADFLLSVNLGGSFLVAGLMFAFETANSMPSPNDSFYLSLRSVYWVSDFLRFPSVNPVSTGAVRREIPGSGEQLAAEITILITGLALVALLFSLLRNCDKWKLVRQMVEFIKVPLLLFAGPILFLTLSWWSWQMPTWDGSPAEGGFFRNSPLPLVFAAESLFLCATVFRRSVRRSRWGLSLLATVHWAFWGYFPWMETRVWFFPLYAQDVFLALLFAATVLWIWRECRVIRLSGEWAFRHRMLLYGFDCAVVVLAALIWHPARNMDLSQPHNWASVEIEVSRGPCFGPCSVYTITVHGDGQVEYTGHGRHSRKETSKSGTLERERIARILQILTQAQFTTLDGRAFGWAFDTPSIGIQVSGDGTTKEVISDSFQERPGRGRQARFLKAAGEVDSILKSASWAKCVGECRQDWE